MSVVIIRAINCDQGVAPDCVFWQFEAPDTAVALRRWARKAGWAVNRPGGEDICPRCVAFIHAGGAVRDSTRL